MRKKRTKNAQTNVPRVSDCCKTDRLLTHHLRIQINISFKPNRCVERAIFNRSFLCRGKNKRVRFHTSGLDTSGLDASGLDASGLDAYSFQVFYRVKDRKDGRVNVSMCVRALAYVCVDMK